MNTYTPHHSSSINQPFRKLENYIQTSGGAAAAAATTIIPQYIYSYLTKSYHVLSYSIQKIVSWIHLPQRTESMKMPSLPTFPEFVLWIRNIISTIPPQLVFTLLCFSYILYQAYIKIKYPYWNLVPIRHTYDIKPRFVSSPYLIYTGQFMPKTKYNDTHWQIITFPFLDKKVNEYYDKIIDLLRCHYIPADNTIYSITLSQFIAYHTGSNEPSFITIYSVLEYNTMLDNTKQELLENNVGVDTTDTRVSEPPNSMIAKNNGLPSIEKMQGVMTSRFCNFYVWNKGTCLHWKSYYVHYFCMDKHNTKARNLFQTHMSNVFKRNQSIKMAVFKKEIDLCPGVVPLVQFNTYMYSVSKNGIQQPVPLPQNHTIIEINSSNNLDILANTLNFLEYRKQFSCIVSCDMPYYLALLHEKIMHIYCHSYKDIIYGIYIFKKTHVEYEINAETEDETMQSSVEITCLQNIKSGELFYSGFINALTQYIKLFKPRILLIENIGDNCAINKTMQQYTEYLTATVGAYYTYNLVIPECPFNEEKCVVLV